MKSIMYVLAVTVLLVTGCTESNDSKIKDPSFLPGCFRKEVATETFIIPEMDSAQEATYLQQIIRVQPGYIDSRSNLQDHTLTINYSSSLIRKMNFEEAIAMAGYSVNARPGYSQAKIPTGVR